MSYQALARKWRPRFFSEVIGQNHVVSALSNALDQNRVHHAFLFTGTRGVGKTTLARIFAKALNCEQGVSSQPCGECTACRGIDEGRFMDLIEVDAASRTRVDDTRELLNNVQYTPTQGRYKVYLIDEVHMLSGHSFNALLKTLEEPPEHVKFLLATTDPQKLPKTILSRCIQFNLKALNMGKIAGQLEKILDTEEIDYEPAALTVLARSANGSVRDALSLLDQAIAFGESGVRETSVRAMLGMIDNRFLVELVDRLMEHDAAGLLETISQMVERAVDFPAALDDLLSLLHNIALYQAAPEAVEWKNIETGEIARIAPELDSEALQLFYQIGLIGKRDLPLAPDPRTGFEMVMLRMLAFQPKLETAEAGGSTRGASPSEAMASKRRRSAAVSAKPRQAPAPVEARTPDAGTPSEKQPAKAAPRMPSQFTLDDLTSHPEAWATLIEQSGVSGIVKELAMNMAPIACENSTLKVNLEASHKRMCSKERLRKIEQQCSETLGTVFKLDVDQGKQQTESAPQRETPARRREREKQERQQTAQQNFENDRHVREIVERFDAEIIPGSVKPPEQQ
ncbi:MAG: DNA polymerase III subunit gamma/tau [Pseudomonadota bacterium]|nr:DNA polymerase III subunit gamma/tau [Pseudomonadota bacterium]